MRRITPTRIAFFTLFALAVVGLASMAFAATAPSPLPTSVVIHERIFNDCPTSTLTSVNNYPALVSIEDTGMDCFGFANLHNWQFSVDGVNAVPFDNNSAYRYSFDLVISGTGIGEAGILISPWWSQVVDGRFMVNAETGEIACFGGRLPFYTFTGAFGLHYVKGNPIHLEAIYNPHALASGNPATIEYKLTYLGTDYTSGILPFDMANPAEDPPHGLWGMLNDGRVGAYFQPKCTPANATGLKATFTNIVFGTTPDPNGATVVTRIFNDCPSSTVTTVNNYPALISIQDSGLDCLGFANLHNWSFSEDGGANPAVFNNDSKFRFSADVVVSGDGNGEGGLRISPWWSKDVDGRFMINATTGEIACFGGRLPFYTFTGGLGLHYTKGDLIHMEAIYDPRSRTSVDPATIEYKLNYKGTDYTRGVIPFDMANPAEDPPWGLWGMLNDGRVGGYFQPGMTPTVASTMTATWTNIKFTQCLHPASVKFDVFPGIFILRDFHWWQWVNAYITPAAPFKASDIDVSSLRINGLAPISSRVIWFGKTLRVTLNRHDFIGTLVAGNHVPVSLTGEIGAGCMDAVDFVRVFAPRIHKPCGGDHLTAGTQTEVTWDADPDGVAVTIMSSIDDGNTWSVDAQNVPNTGSFMWTVPNVATDVAHVQVITVYPDDPDGSVNQAEYASTDAFSISTPTGVEAGAATFSLHPRNPAMGAMNVSFSLATTAPATLSVYDISGRQVTSREVGSLGRGSHTMNLGDLPAGLYIVRLSQAGHSLSSRVAVIR